MRQLRLVLRRGAAGSSALARAGPRLAIEGNIGRVGRGTAARDSRLPAGGGRARDIPASSSLRPIAFCLRSPLGAGGV